ncbi:MAG: helix-turn-helix domain-containing protein, partial [Bacteroidota bacterium]|nr:helix-turn-helix domain-containing protein [Bacteroidota bacterium]
MKTIQKTYRFALLPTREQEVLLNKHFGCVRFVYNHFL